MRSTWFQVKGALDIPRWNTTWCCRSLSYLLTLGIPPRSLVVIPPSFTRGGIHLFRLLLFVTSTAL